MSADCLDVSRTDTDRLDSGPDRHIERAVLDAVASVADPEYPDISIRDLGLVESIQIDGAIATVGLIPTFSGCPALSMIATDVQTAVGDVPEIESCIVQWLTSPVWSTGRISIAARSKLGSDYTVTLRRKDGTLRCPSCGSDDVADQSAAGPTRCRSVAWCNRCRNIVEVMR